MSPVVRLRPQAQAELQEAYSWYETASPGLGERFLAAIEATYQAIAENPRRFARAYGFRRAVVAAFPYCVYFRVEPDHVLVIAVFHGRRSPRQLGGRK